MVDKKFIYFDFGMNRFIIILFSRLKTVELHFSHYFGIKFKTSQEIDRNGWLLKSQITIQIGFLVKDKNQ